MVIPLPRALRRIRGVLAGVVAATVVGALAVGCGGSEDPTAAVPSLSDRLEAVDTAIAQGDYAAARDAIDELVHTTTEARETGDLEADRADAIISAAARLEAQLPQGSGSASGEEPTDGEASATETADPEVGPDVDEGESSGNGSGKGHGKDKDKGKGSGKSNGHD